MDKQKIQILAAGALGLVLVVLLFGNMFGKRSSGSAPVTQSSDSVSQIFREFDANVSYLANKEINDTLERIMQEKLQEGWQRNPFQILVSTKMEQEIAEEELVSVGEPTFAVSGIIYAQTEIDSQVIVNGELYKVGDTIEGWTVVTIEDEMVLFENGETEYIFNLYLTQE